MTDLVTDTEGLEAFLGDIAREVRERPKDLAFPPEEYQRRLDLIRARMVEADIDLLLLFSMDAICWLHGHQLRWYKAASPRSWPPLACTAVHAAHDRLILFEGFEHRDLVHERSIAQDVRLSERGDFGEKLEFVLGNLRDEGWLGGRTGMERWSFLPNHAVATVVEQALTDEGCTVVDATDLIRRARRVKSPLELAKIEEAARICDVGLLHLQRVLAPGMTELEAWGELMLAMARVGGEPGGIHEMVSVGDVHRNHSWSSTRVIEAGDLLWADPCGVRHRYHANVARCFVVGEVPEPARRIAEIEAGAYPVLCRVARPGTPVRDVARALREYYEDAGVWHLRDSGWVGAYELGVSFPPDWVGDFCWTVGDESAEDVIEAGSVSNYESVIGLPMIDTIIYGEDETRALSRVPLEVLGVAL
jgi:Xaa-Pro aminopeptidase